MAVSLPDFVYSTNEEFVNKVYALTNCWRVGIKPCLTETDLIVLGMYLEFLSTDLSDYSITPDEIKNVMYSIVNIYNITNVTIDNSSTIEYITNVTNNIVYNTTIINSVPTFSMQYSGVNTFTISVNHGLNKYNPSVIVTDTSTGSRIRVEVGITEIDKNNIILSFASSSSGDITIM